MADPVNAIVQGAGARRLTVSRRPPSPGPAASGSASPVNAAPPQAAAASRRPATGLSEQLVTQDGRLLRPAQPRPAAAQPRAPSAAPPVSVAGAEDSREAIRAAEDIIQAAFSGPPTAEGRRIAEEAFLMEAQAQRDYLAQQAQGMAGRRWTA